MTVSDLTTLLDFHYWARDRVLDAAAQLTPEQYTRDMGSSFRSIRDTLAHMYSSEWAWYQRWHGTSPSAMLDPNDYRDVPTLRAAWQTHETHMRAFLNGQTDASLATRLEYRALDGRLHTSRLSEMFQHVVNHGTYHRGQVTTMLRQLAAEPAKSVDLIAYFRTREART